MVPCLLYVSDRHSSATEPKWDIDEMVRAARNRNRRLDVTGALISTKLHFAQYLEGPQAALAELMASIGRHPAHSDLRLMDPPSLETRRFQDWSLATSKPSAFVTEKVQALANQPSRSHTDLTSLLRLMRVEVDDNRYLRSRDAPDSAWSSASSSAEEAFVKHDAAWMGPLAHTQNARGTGAPSMDDQKDDLGAAIAFMHLAQERLDASGADIAAAHLDMAIASAVSVQAACTNQVAAK